MAGDKSLEPESNRDARQEARGRNFGIIGAFAVGLILLTVASIFVSNGLVRYFEMRRNGDQTPPSGSKIDANQLPPEPRLQDRAVQELQQMQAVEDETLNSYGWVDQRKGIMRIPIDRAMDLLAQRALTKPAAHHTLGNQVSPGVPAGAGVASVDRWQGGAARLATPSRPKDGLQSSR
jgi:hypothetical protein